MLVKIHHHTCDQKANPVMNETDTIIQQIEKINNQYQHIHLAVDPPLNQMKPGQSLLVRRDQQGWDPYLRSRWWPVNLLDNMLIVERPINEVYHPGDVMAVHGPIGRPYRFRRTLRTVMLAAYNTVPTPLLMTIPWLLGNNVSLTLVLAGSAVDYDTQHLAPEIEIIHGDDDFVWPNQITSIGWADQIFVVTALDDELRRFYDALTRLRELRPQLPKNYVFAAFQSVLPCGAGACQACMIETIDGPALVCQDGPAYDLTQVKF